MAGCRFSRRVDGGLDTVTADYYQKNFIDYIQKKWNWKRSRTQANFHQLEDMGAISGLTHNQRRRRKMYATSPELSLTIKPLSRKAKPATKTHRHQAQQIRNLMKDGITLAERRAWEALAADPGLRLPAGKVPFRASDRLWA